MFAHVLTIFTILNLMASNKGKPGPEGWVNPEWQHCRHCGAKNNVAGFKHKEWDCWSCGKTNNDQ